MLLLSRTIEGDDWLLINDDLGHVYIERRNNSLSSPDLEIFDLAEMLDVLPDDARAELLRLLATVVADGAAGAETS